MGTLIDRKPVVLAVDDEEDLLFLLQRVLKGKGFEVQISPNADNIIDIVHHAPPDIILLDIRMNGIDGATLCHVLKANRSTASIPIIMFSANDDIKETADTCGADGYLQKPFNSQKFDAELFRILGFKKNTITQAE